MLIGRQRMEFRNHLSASSPDSHEPYRPYQPCTSLCGIYRICLPISAPLPRKGLLCFIGPALPRLLAPDLACFRIQAQRAASYFPIPATGGQSQTSYHLWTSIHIFYLTAYHYHYCISSPFIRASLVSQSVASQGMGFCETVVLFHQLSKQIAGSFISQMITP
jgi:hypothetical protein